MSENLADFDQHHVWHPYSSATPPLPNLVVRSASGVRIQLEDGCELIDAMASWWSALHGYNHPVLNQAVTDQVADMSHVMFGGLTHEPAVTLCANLLKTVPPDMQHVFLADSGSVAVEVALKMAFQYQLAIGQGQRSKVAALRGGYHGDTLGAMSVCDPDAGMHQLFSDYVPRQLFVDRPSIRYGDAWDDQALDGIRAMFEANHSELAAFILEPIVQGAGGMWFYAREYVQGIRELCDEFGVLLIADEIATAFGRTGHWLACDDSAVVPDILCVGKALTGGYLSLAATLTTSRVAEGISGGQNPELMHGPTFMGNPLACAVANANLVLLQSGEWPAQVAAIHSVLKEGLAEAEGFANVTDVRVHGAIGVIETAQPVDMKVVQDICLDEGVWLRPFGRLIYTMPPYVMGVEDLVRVTSTMKRMAKQVY
ncbi:MAG: adenosylmethionine--8-amino-7-oxononanoate transaminase [Proteobacteria bacterium]|jgi:adenosylmethionine---8-amino-7-oxononanoate aminotransferase|nr:adenosylmethionine--8-amino-7-oxononanoate transaminase [Pseudomonadota bacterium]